jgi:hypothetical protein
MDRKDNEPKGTAATASKMAVNKKQGGDESPSNNQDQSTQNQSGTGAQNQQSHEGQDLLQQAKQTTNEVVNQVQQQANSQINRQKETAASELSTVVNAVRRFGETLNNEGQGPIARFAAQYGDKAANNLDRAAQYLRDKDPKQLLNDVQNFGRRQPALLIGGAFLLGFAGARIIKSSMDAASSSSMNTVAQRTAMNTGNTEPRSSANPGAQQQQSFNTNVSGARPLPPPPNQP